MKNRIAIIGDVHGKINEMYSSVRDIEKASGTSVDAIVQLGDMQLIRDAKDLGALNVPEKHRETGDFPEYHSRGKVPVLTYFIGGNHENQRLISQFPGGTEIVNNLHYLGRAGTAKMFNLNVGWVSGNYSPKDYNLGGKKYHFTSEDLRKLEDASLDLLLLHDWPNMRKLSQHISKSQFNKTLEEATKRGIGNDPFYNLIASLKPKLVACGHVHAYLNLEAEISGQRVRFLSLASLGRENSIALLTPETGELKVYTVEKNQGLFDCLPREDKESLGRAFNNLNRGDLEIAISSFQSLISKTSSPLTESFCSYGLGAAYIKKSQGLSSFQDIESSISYLRAAIKTGSHADAHLMLGHALKNRAVYIIRNGLTESEKTILPGILHEAETQFHRAQSLNKGYAQESKEEISRVRRLAKKIIRSSPSRN